MSDINEVKQDRTKPHRVQLDFYENSLRDLDELKELTSASGRAEVIRNALRWMFWCAEEVSRGGTIVVERDGKQREVVFPHVRRSSKADQAL